MYLVFKHVNFKEVMLNIDGDIIKQTDEFTYLGRTITSDGYKILKRTHMARLAVTSRLLC